MPTAPLTDKETRRRTTGGGERYNVILYNDDVNDFDHVILTLMQVVGVDKNSAVAIAYTAHNYGTAIAATTHKEHAEAYREGLENGGLTATIEPA